MKAKRKVVDTGDVKINKKDSSEKSLYFFIAENG